MNPFALLGLSADADEAQIKRAYAKLLRSHRPDDDPAGFQRLNEAYRQCLERAQRRAAAEAAMAVAAGEGGDPDESGGGEHAPAPGMPPAPRPPPVPVADAEGPTAPQPPAAPAPFAPAAPRTPFVASAPPPPEPAQPPLPPVPDPAQPSAPAAPAAESVPSVPAAPTAAPRAPRPPAGGAPEPVPAAPQAQRPAPATPKREPEFDAHRFLDELYRRAETDSVAELERWLANHPALYRLERKHALAPALVACLSARAPLYLPQLDALLRFFDLDTVHPRSAGLQARIVELRAQTRRRGVDLREIQFDPNPKPGKRGRHPIDLDASTVVFLLLGFTVLARVVAALAGAGRP